jgi:glucose/arabinose dehydrogenase
VALSAFLPAAIHAAVCTGISPASSAILSSVLVAPGLDRPLFVTAPPNDVSRLFILEQAGRIRIVRGSEVLPTPFLDISAITASPENQGYEEQGLLGLAFDPGFATNGYFYIYSTPLVGGSNIVARYTRSASDPDLADPNSEVVMLAIDHPTFFHNAGTLAFSPADGYLYLSVGDGGDYCDQVNNAQSGQTDLGKILRVDVRQVPAAIPPSNPFFGPDGINDEIWALGLRNPWRFSFDDLTSDLYVADVGQAHREEIDFQPAGSPGGQNYGWNLYEGSVCPNPSCGSATCSVPGYAPPALDYDHTQGCAVIGGYVYRGCRMPDLSGTYFYGDLCSAFVRTFRMAGGQVTDPRDITAELAPGGGSSISSITSFGVDGRGEIYVVDGGLKTGNIGSVFKIVPILSELEVSGIGAKRFTVDNEGWSWENLKATSSVPISQYQVYRSPARTGPFQCIHATSQLTWSGDASLPPVGGAFYYLVTAVNSAGMESSPGAGSSGSSRPLSSQACPP